MADNNTVRASAIEKVRAYARGVDVAPRKVGLVASLVRGRTVADAVVILSHTPKRGARPLIKVIESARANAVNNHGFDAKTIVISTLSVTTGTRMKRFHPASRGRALPYVKKSSNILVEVTGELKPKKPAAKPAEATEAPKADAKGAKEEKK